jgi:phage shock protein PspC (stress-responsive transcriptional regulator)
MNRRLYRSRHDSVLGGVAGGVADYLDVDPSVVRIVWAILALVTGGIFLVLYIVMWIVVPEAPDVAPAPPGVAGMPGATDAAGTMPAGDAAPGWVPPATGQRWAATARRHRGGSGGAWIFGLILIAAGVWFLVDEYLPAFDRDLLWPIALVLVGGALLVVSLRRPRAE